MDNAFARELVADNEEVRKYLNVIECNTTVSVLLNLHLVFRLEAHLLDHLEAALRLIRRLHRECSNSIASVTHIISDASCICLVENSFDEVYIWSSVGVHLFAKCFRDERS